MNRPKLLQLATSLVGTRRLGLNSSGLTQVTRYSQLTIHSPPFINSVINPRIGSVKYFNLHQRLSFSTSKSETFVDLISSSDWSKEIEIELGKMLPKLTHESVVYGFLKLNENPRKSLDFYKWVTVNKGFGPSYVTYGLLLRSLACKDFFEDFWTVALEVQEKGLFVKASMAYKIVSKLEVEKLYEAAKDWIKLGKTMWDVYAEDDVSEDVMFRIRCSWDEEVKSNLKKKLKFPLSESFVLYALLELQERHKPERALQFFDWVGDCGGYKHDSITYNTMLVILAHSNELVDEFWNLVERMKREGFDVDHFSLISICKDLPVSDAIMLYEMMMEDGPYKPSLPDRDLRTKNITQELNPDMDLAYRVMNKCVAAGYTLSKTMYNGMHGILCKIGKFDEAKKIVQEMRKAGYKPDSITYNQEVYGLCAQKMLEQARVLLDQMEAEGCIPDSETWTILLQGYCAAGRVDEALSCFSEMVGKNVNPDAKTLDVLLHGFLSKNEMLGAHKFLIEMVCKHDIIPLEVTYARMIWKLVEFEKLKEALELIRMMKKQKHEPCTYPIFEHISKTGTLDDVKVVFKALTPKGAPSTAAYVQVIRCFTKQGRDAEAREFLNKSPSRVRSHERISYLLPEVDVAVV